MQKATNSLLPLLCALPIAALFSSPASAATTTGSWTSSCSILALPVPPPLGAKPTGLYFDNCTNNSTGSADDLHLTFVIPRANAQGNPILINGNPDPLNSITLPFNFDFTLVPKGARYTPPKPVLIITFADLIKVGYPAEIPPNTKLLFLSGNTAKIKPGDSFWTKKDKCGGSIKLPNASKKSESEFAWGIFNPLTNFLMPPAYAAEEVCKLPEPNQSLGIIVGGVTMLLLGIKRARKF